MPRPSAILTAGPIIVGARRVGSPLRACAAAAGVPWITVAGWLKRGRAALELDEVPEADQPFADFVTECDRASAQLEQVLRARVLKGTEEDARLALDYVRWLDGERARRAERKLLAAKVETERRKVHAPDSVQQKSDDEIDARINELLTKP
jgi:hypothetical protein